MSGEGSNVVLGVLRYLAGAAGIPEHVALRGGVRLVVSWWKLNLWIDPRFRYCGRGRWLPGVSLSGCDPDGRFGNDLNLRLFDEAAFDWDRARRFGRFFRLVADRGLSNEALAAAGYRRRLRDRRYGAITLKCKAR